MYLNQVLLEAARERAYDGLIIIAAPKGKAYLGTFSLNTAAIDSADTLDWSFTVSDSAIDSLKAGGSKIQSYDVTIDDGHGGTAAQTITIILVGADDARSSSAHAPRSRSNNPVTIRHRITAPR